MPRKDSPKKMRVKRFGYDGKPRAYLNDKHKKWVEEVFAEVEELAHLKPAPVYWKAPGQSTIVFSQREEGYEDAMEKTRAYREARSDRRNDRSKQRHDRPSFNTSSKRGA
ncbi:hypothetical protein M3196_13885 [Fictibacillus nanhaiensis]|uniref:hypothetical protein n=1 Tax=Fictibacillus nanhaiensis TaxID=742169 RepID=UPI002040108F|nr:hypothetical protein [Fictibacillus nanhaiensis]MCM3732740.1 hypothetical protein [Fictibacillus nanhaiensis]